MSVQIFGGVESIYHRVKIIIKIKGSEGEKKK